MTYLPNSALLSVMRVSGIAIATRLQAHQTEPKISVTSPFTAERSARYRLQQTTVPSRPVRHVTGTISQFSLWCEGIAAHMDLKPNAGSCEDIGEASPRARSGVLRTFLR
jgi:hypothetical protein